MVGSIERLRRHLQVRSLAPMMLLVIGVPNIPDPIAKRVGGTAGVITMPALPAPASASTHGDALADGHRDTRADRGRILYAPGHAPHDSTAATARAVRKQVCVEQQAMHGRDRNSAPTS